MMMMNLSANKKRRTPLFSETLCAAAPVRQCNVLLSITKLFFIYISPQPPLPITCSYYSGSLYLEALLHLSGQYRAWI